MKPFMKVGSFLLAAIMLCSALFVAGCTPVSLTKEWSYKYGDKQLPIGVYIYSLSVAYNQAESYAKDQLGDKYDAYSDDWLNKKIKDDDDNEQVAREWIKEQAKIMCLSYLVMDEQIEAEGIDVSGATLDTAYEQAENYWNLGPYASQNYIMPMKDDYEPYGVSLESFSYCTLEYNTKKEALYEKLYNEGGKKAVSDDELTKYFTENYTDYKYLPVNLYESTTDEAGEQKDVALSDKDISKIKKDLDKYAKEINGGKSYDDIINAYLKDYGVESDPSQKGVEILDDSSVGEEIKNAIKELKTNKASTIQVGEGDSAIYYLVFKDDIKNDVDSYIKDTQNRPNVLRSMKYDEYEDYIEELAKKLDAEENTGVIDQYKPEMFYVKPDPTTAPAEESEDSAQ